MLHHELVAALEQVGERAPAFGRVEDVVLLHSYPWQFAALPAQFVPFPGEFFFSGQVLQARLQPFVFRSHFVLALRCSHWVILSSFTHGYARAARILNARWSDGPCGVMV